MRTYRDFTNFINEVEQNNLFNIKSELSNMILFFDGDEERIQEAIEYAKNKSSFDFEDNKEYNTQIELKTAEDRYDYESSNLLLNFSEERLKTVIGLYCQLPKQVAEETSKINTIDLPQNSERLDKKTLLLIAVGVAIAGAIGIMVVINKS